jgi:hypothetical protein
MKDCLLCEADIAVILEPKQCILHKYCFNHKHCYNFQKTKHIYHTTFPKTRVFIIPQKYFCFFCQKLQKHKIRSKNFKKNKSNHQFQKKICSCIVKKLESPKKKAVLQ